MGTVRENIELHQKQLDVLQELDRDVSKIDCDVGAANLSVDGNIVEVTATVHNHPKELKELIAAYNWSDHSVEFESPPKRSSDGRFSWRLEGRLNALAHKGKIPKPKVTMNTSEPQHDSDSSTDSESSTSIEQQTLEEVIEDSFREMEEKGLKPRDWEVYIDQGELFANVWFTQDDEGTLEERKEEGMDIIKSHLSEQSILTTAVNANYQTDGGVDRISCWWHLA